MIKAMETRPCEARLKELELFLLEKTRDSLKNPSPEMNHTNSMLALIFLLSAAFIQRGNQKPYWELIGTGYSLCPWCSVKSVAPLSQVIVTTVL